MEDFFAEYPDAGAGEANRAVALETGIFSVAFSLI